MFKETYFFSRSIANTNEDCGYICNNYAFVLDGATGLSKKKFTDYGSDACWYSKTMSEYLKDNLSDYNKEIRDILYQGIETISKEYECMTGGDFEPIDSPSAVGCITRINKHKLEYLVFGDSPLLIKYKDGHVEEVYDEKLVQLDNYAIKKCKDYAEEKGITFREALPFVVDVIKSNRLKMNTPEGYYNLSFYAQAAYEGGLYGMVDLCDIESICLMSDGYADCYTLMGIVSTPAEFMELLWLKGAEFIYEQLLRAQKEDSTLDGFPRFKLSDDCTCAFAHL